MESPTKGSLSETSFIEILKDAAQSNFTGMVRLENGTIIKVVYLQAGMVAFASSNEKTDRLTEVLKRAGKLTPEQVEDAHARLKPNVSLGKTLVELGYISARDLLWGAKAQVEGILHKLLFWTQGTYQLLEGRLPKEIISLSIPISHIIFDGVLATQDRNWVLQQIGSPEAIYALSGEFHEKNAVYKLPVEFVVSRIDGKRSLEQIAELAGIDSFEACKVVAALQLLGLAGRIPDRPVQIPLTAPSAQREELVMETLETSTNPKQDLSLGQVLQLPTVEELQEKTVETIQKSPAQQNNSNTLKIDELRVGVAPGERDKEEPPIAKTRKIPPPTFSTKGDAPKPFHDAPSPLSGMTFSARRKKTLWDPKREILLVVSVLVIGGLVFGYYWRRVQQETASNDVNIPSFTPRTAEKQPPSETNKPETSAQIPKERSPTAAETATPPANSTISPEAPPSPLTLARLGKLPEAARNWRKQISREQSKFTIQILIACQEKTVLEVLQTLEYSEEISILPIDFKGQSCYRVLYGIFPSHSAASDARGNLPPQFMEQPSPPQVVSVSKILR